MFSYIGYIHIRMKNECGSRAEHFICFTGIANRLE